MKQYKGRWLLRRMSRRIYEPRAGMPRAGRMMAMNRWMKDRRTGSMKRWAQLVKAR